MYAAGVWAKLPRDILKMSRNKSFYFRARFGAIYSASNWTKKYLLKNCTLGNRLLYEELANIEFTFPENSNCLLLPDTYQQIFFYQTRFSLNSRVLLSANLAKCIYHQWNRDISYYSEWYLLFFAKFLHPQIIAAFLILLSLLLPLKAWIPWHNILVLYISLNYSLAVLLPLKAWIPFFMT